MIPLKTTGVRLATSALANTWRIRIAGREHLSGLTETGTPFIYALWHCQILPLLWYHRRSGAVLVVSGHDDGGLIAGAARAWGLGVIRGSSTRGGFVALRGAVKALASGHPVAITPDGPRGPAHMVKPGILKIAELSGSPILPVTARVRRGWRLRSWDRFILPAPLARIEIQYMPPIRVVRGGSEGMDQVVAAALNSECS